MTEKEAEALRDNLGEQVASMKDPPKALIVIKFGKSLTFKFIGMGPGETADLAADVRRVMLKTVANEQ